MNNYNKKLFLLLIIISLGLNVLLFTILLRKDYNLGKYSNEILFLDRINYQSMRDVLQGYRGHKYIEYWKIKALKLHVQSYKIIKAIDNNRLDNDSLGNYLETAISSLFYNSYDLNYIDKYLNSIYEANYGNDFKEVLKYKVKFIEFFALATINNKINMSYYELDRINVKPFITEDTIKLGEEFKCPIYVVADNSGNPFYCKLDNGEVVKNEGIYPVYRCVPKTKGPHKQTGQVVFRNKGNLMKLNFEINYYVK